MDREKYMDQREAETLRTVTEARAIIDMQVGRRGGVPGWCVVDVSMNTGLWASEMARLNVGDFDPKRQSLKVWRHKRKKHAQETLAIGKDFAKHLREFVEWKRSVSQAIGRSDALFVGKRGPLTAIGLAQIWKSAVKRAGLPKEISIHCARHTMAVHLLKKTGNLRMVQKQLGHASPATTANMYADVSFEDMQDGLNGLYGGG